MESPVLSNSQFKKLFESFDQDQVQLIDCTFDKNDKNLNLKSEIDRIREESEISIRSGKKHLIISDKNISKDRVSIPVILAVGAVQSHLTQIGLRKFVSINVQSSECLDTHYYAVLIGAGATTVNAYLTIDSIHQRFQKGLFNKLTFEECVHRYIKAVNDGLLKDNV